MQYIDTQSALDQAADRLAAAGHACFDSEFLRERTYYPELCLAQVAIDDDILVIDPLADTTQATFWSALLDTPLTLHSGRQDLEVLHVALGRLPGVVFDTQVAAGIAGWPPQVGYATLVEEICEVRLDKAHTRTNWKRRPLSPAVLDYAADDVRHLGRVQAHLVERLEALGRLDWAREDSAALLDPVLYVTEPRDAWQRLRGIGRLPAEAQQRAVALAAWREALAQQKNLPRQWLLRDDALLSIAWAGPADADAVGRCRDVPEKFASRYGRDVVRALREPLPPPPVSGGPPDDEQKRLAKALAARLRALAGDMAIEPEVLAPQRELRQIASGDRDVRALSGWRRDIVGPAIAELLPESPA